MATMLNKKIAFPTALVAGLLLLAFAAAGALNEYRTAGPYEAGVAAREDRAVEVAFGTGSMIFIIPDLPPEVKKGVKARVYTTSLMGRGETPRKLEFLDGRGALIHSTTLPVSVSIISTAIISLILLLFAAAVRLLPEEVLMKEHAVFSDEDDEEEVKAEAPPPDAPAPPAPKAPE